MSRSGDNAIGDWNRQYKVVGRDSLILRGGGSGMGRGEIEEGKDVHCSRVRCRGRFEEGRLKELWGSRMANQADTYLAVTGPVFIPTEHAS